MTPGLTIYLDDESYAFVRRFMDLTKKSRSNAIQVLIRRGYIEAVRKPEAQAKPPQIGV